MIKEAVIIYLDPGSGSIILQVLIAIITGAIFYIALIRKKIADFFRRLTGRKKND